MAVFRPAPLPGCAAAAWYSPAEVSEPSETLRVARPIHLPVPHNDSGIGRRPVCEPAIQQIAPALASALPVSHTALSRSSSASHLFWRFRRYQLRAGDFTHV